MGNFLERILNKMNVTDEDDFDDFDDYDTEFSARKEKKKTERISQVAATEEPQTLRKETAKVSSVAAKPQKSYEEDKFDYDYAEVRKERAQRTSAQNRVVPLRSASASASRILEVSIMKPTRFDDSQDICDMLVNERATVVNLEGIDLGLAQRIMDFISGAVYSLNGKIHQISNLIFIVSPENVDISGDYLSYVEQNGFEVPTLNQ
ncbi:MAG: cell division protein SepF [Lachnospiraceae bacterium]|nr:cell division protein SepF [Lachnospiraceae bacterium]